MFLHKKICCLLILLLSGYMASAQCYNGDLEANDFTNWTRWTSVNTNGFFDIKKAKHIPSQSTDFTRHVIETPGIDSRLGPSVSLPKVFEGSYSLRLGDLINNNGAELIAYTFTVTNPSFAFNFAVVFEKGHTDNIENPFFSYVLHPGGASLTKLAVPNTIIGSRRFESNTNKIPLKTSGGFVYSDWQTECIDLTKWMGQTVTIYFISSDCYQNAHTGYVYLDGLCKTTPNATPSFTHANPVCKFDELWVNGSASQNVRDHYWKIEEWAGNPGAPVPGTAEKFNFFGQQPGYIADMLTNYAKRGHSPRNGWYRITLGVKGASPCHDWVETTSLVYVAVPMFSFVQTSYKCCWDQNAPVFVSRADQTFGNTASAQTWYNDVPFHWFDPDGQNIAATTTTFEQGESDVYVLTSTFTPPHGRNGQYHVEYTDANGCKNVEYFYVVNKTDFRVDGVHHYCVWDCQPRPNQLTANYYYLREDYCGDGFDEQIYNWAIDESNHTYLWSTGETTKTINVRPGVNYYTCVISNGCYSHTVVIDLDNRVRMTGPAHIAYPTVFSPNGDGKNDVFRVWDPNKIPNGIPSYNALELDFRVFNRWGQWLKRTWTTAPCEGFHNWMLEWDGTQIGKNGRKGNLDIGVYHWLLISKNCDNQEHVAKTDITLIR